MNRMIRNLIENIREDWKEIGNDRDQKGQKKGKH